MDLSTAIYMAMASLATIAAISLSYKVGELLDRKLQPAREGTAKCAKDTATQRSLKDVMNIP
eukprot:3304447-Pyramimonas_sp.AAC.2